MRNAYLSGFLLKCIPPARPDETSDPGGSVSRFLFFFIPKERFRYYSQKKKKKKKEKFIDTTFSIPFEFRNFVQRTANEMKFFSTSEKQQRSNVRDKLEKKKQKERKKKTRG